MTDSIYIDQLDSESEKAHARALEHVGYRYLGRDPYRDNLHHVAELIGNGHATRTVGHFGTLEEAIDWALERDGEEE